MSLFLFGMGLMGDGLKRVAGSKLELVLYRLTSSTVKGVLLGTGVTAIIQSSSATSVMVVGFVNSGMMHVRQAIGIILGAILGTSITGWILCLSDLQGAQGWVSLISTSTLTGLVAVVGIVLYMFSKNQTKKYVGSILLGFAVLMYGMQAMTSAVSPLRESEAFIALLTRFSNPIIGILVGTGFTCILQSASAAVGILQALAITGTIDFSVALPITLGIAIGASVPVLLSAIGANANGKRTAFAYLLIDTIGAVFWGAVFYIANAAVGGFGFMGMTMTAVTVALMNTLFRLLTLLLLMPFIGVLEKIVTRLFPEDPNAARAGADIDRLDERFIAHPSLAIEQCRHAVNTMADIVRRNLVTSIELLDKFSEESFKTVQSMEDLIDRYEDRLGSYLVRIAANELTERETTELSKYLHTIGDLERIGDHSMNIAEAAEEIASKKLRFSPAAKRELTALTGAVSEILDHATEALRDENLESAYHIEPLEEVVDNLCDEMKMHHVARLKDGTCTLSQSFVFNDLLTDCERIGDHCSNIALALIEMDNSEFDAHAYLSSLKEQRSNDFDKYFDDYSRKYAL